MHAPESATVCQHCGKTHSEPRGFDLSQMLRRGDTEVKIDTAYLKCLFDRLNKMHEDNTRLQRKLNSAIYDSTWNANSEGCDHVATVSAG